MTEFLETSTSSGKLGETDLLSRTGAIFWRLELGPFFDPSLSLDSVIRFSILVLSKANLSLACPLGTSNRVAKKLNKMLQISISN